MWGCVPAPPLRSERRGARKRNGFKTLDTVADAVIQDLEKQPWEGECQTVEVRGFGCLCVRFDARDGEAGSQQLPTQPVNRSSEQERPAADSSSGIQTLTHVANSCSRGRGPRLPAHHAQTTADRPSTVCRRFARSAPSEMNHATCAISRAPLRAFLAPQPEVDQRRTASCRLSLRGPSSYKGLQATRAYKGDEAIERVESACALRWPLFSSYGAGIPD
ncbi:hypothetical protein SVAN01_09142 [Stagonosporopsis vannaccii]|nr:hypothetical protein SVAN01_09142 [Stagonosporopsis vannaccii]